MPVAITFGHIWLIGGYFLAFLGVALMLRTRRSPGATIAWLLAFFVLPYVGFVIFLLIGNRKSALGRKVAIIENRESRSSTNIRLDNFAEAIRQYGGTSVTGGNSTIICGEGAQGYQQLVELVQGAQERLFVETFIFANDDLGSQILQRLAERARAGVDVRVLVDGVGSIKTPRRFFQPLVEAGGQFTVFNPAFRLPLISRSNLRNHRKIVVADGNVSFSGGMNLSREDLYSTPMPGAWSDLSLLLRGPAAACLEQVFLSDWNYASRTSDEIAFDLKTDNQSVDSQIQLLASGPNCENDRLYATTLMAIHRARNRIWIATPYFVPNEAAVEALLFACQRGVDVRILIPLRSNHLMADLAGAQFLKEIATAGGKVLRFNEGMMHAKAMVIDDLFAMVGSANFDMRSLFLNYEVVQLCYSKCDIEALCKWFVRLSQCCDTDFPNPSILRRFGERLMYIISPML